MASVDNPGCVHHGSKTTCSSRGRRGGRRRSKAVDGSHINGCNELRGCVLALRHAIGAESTSEAVACVEKALWRHAERADVVDTALIGMAAMEACRLQEYNLVGLLCTFIWPRLGLCGGREVAQLISAAVKSGHYDQHFFSSVATFCIYCPQRFTSLRDVSEVGAGLLRCPAIQSGCILEPHSWIMDRALTFHGIACAALPLVSCQQSAVRDHVEILHVLSQVLEFEPLGGGAPLCESVVVCDVVRMVVSKVRNLLHKASNQDLSKVAGAIATWCCAAKAPAEVLDACWADVVRLACLQISGFSPQDVALTIVALVKQGQALDTVSASTVCKVASGHLRSFSHKDLALLLWGCTRLDWLRQGLAGAASKELVSRDISQFQAIDLSMCVQALAKLGNAHKPALCILFGEVSTRQQFEFRVMDKVFLLWAFAKARVVQEDLLSSLAKCLAIEVDTRWPRDCVSAALWALARLLKRLPTDTAELQKFALDLVGLAPWVGAPPHEVANATWAIGQLQENEGSPFRVGRAAWASLVQTVAAQDLEMLPEHELCNLLSGILVCPIDLDEDLQLATRIAAALCKRMALVGRALSGRDRRCLFNAIARGRTRIQAYARSCGDPDAVASQGEDRHDQDASLTSSRNSVWVRVRTLAIGARRDECQDAGGDVEPDLDLEEPNCHAAAAEPSPQPSASPVFSPSAFPAPWVSRTLRRTQARSNACRPAVPSHWRTSFMACRRECCPTILPEHSPDVRLNAHCDYEGHCVQLKNTFIHVECYTQSDSDSDDCMVCRISRSRSCDTLPLSGVGHTPPPPPPP